MARYTCPSCGAPYNGRHCRACNYEHFSEEIAHNGHVHRGEPLVIGGSERKPIPRKDPFGCEEETRKWSFPKREKKQHPFRGLIAIFLVLYSLLPLVRDWGLELEAREEAARLEMEIPENLVTLYQKGDLSILTPSENAADFSESLQLWYKNDSDQDLEIGTKYVTVNGCVLPISTGWISAEGKSYTATALHLYSTDLKDAGIDSVQELTVLLEVADENYCDLFETDPITLRTDGQSYTPVSLSGTPLFSEDGLRVDYLRYRPGADPGKYTDGYLLFCAENPTDTDFTLFFIDANAGGEEVDMNLFSELPAHSRSLVRIELWPLEDLDFSDPAELGDLTMTLDFWTDDQFSGKSTRFTIPMVQ